MASFGNAFLIGLNSGRAEKQRRAEEERTKTNFEQRQAGLADLQGEFGDRAYTPTEFGQLQGTQDRALAAEQSRTQTAGQIQDEETLRRQAAALRGNKLLDLVVKRAVENGESPDSAVLAVAGRMTPQAQSLFGFDDPANMQGILEGVNQNPNYFSDIVTSLTDTKSTGSTAAPKFSTGEVTLADGSTVRGEIIKNPDGTVGLVGNPTAKVTGFVPDDAYAPQQVGSDYYRRTGVGAPTAAQDVSGSVYEGAVAKAQGTEVGKERGSRQVEDEPLSQTESDAIGRQVRSQLSSNLVVMDTIDNAIDGIDWQSSGTLNQLRRVDGTKATNIQALLTTVGANATLNKLMEIKASGATLGQVTERELDLLQNSVANLNNSQTPAQLRDNLRIYKAQLKRTTQAIEDAYNAKLERGIIKPMTQSQREQGGGPEVISVDAFLSGQ
jgi:hypothetical protein